VTALIGHLLQYREQRGSFRYTEVHKEALLNGRKFYNIRQSCRVSIALIRLCDSVCLSVCVPVCPHDITKTAETKIAKQLAQE